MTLKSSSATTGATTVWPEGRVKVAFAAGGGRPLPGRIKDPAQEIQPLIFLADAGEVARRRVARRAFAGAFKVRATGGGVAGGQVGGLDGTASAPKFGELIHLRMQERDDRIQLALRKAWECGHAGVRPARANDGRQLIALRVLRHEFGASEVGPGLAARGVLAVAEAALGSEPHFALANLVGGIVLRRRGLRPGLGCRALGARRSGRPRLRIRWLAEGDRSDSEKRDGFHFRIQESYQYPARGCWLKVALL